MARLARSEYLDPQAIQIVHVTNRCVRRAFLCGNDPYSGKCYEHRRQWIRERIEFLASLFAIDCLTFAVMSNHVHLILRSRPDIVRCWSDREVAERWLKLCPPRQHGKAIEPTEFHIASLTNNAMKVAELRVRLSDISWWMRLTAQKIACQANREDGCTGRFWEGRYKAQALLDEAAILACAVYVDLNPIRAAIAQSLEGSEFTGAKARIDDLKASQIDLAKSKTDSQSHCVRRANRTQRAKPTKTKRLTRTKRWERRRGRVQSGWLSPFEIDESADCGGTDISPCGRRASLKGFVSISLLKYLELVDWTGRQLRGDKRGSIPEDVDPILHRLGIDTDRWLDLATDFGRLFKRAAGNSNSISEEATRRDQYWLQAPGASCFSCD